MKQVFAWIMLAAMVMSLRPPLLKTGEIDQNRPLWMRYPVISPDGQTIVFSYKGDLFKVNTGGGTATPLTTNAGHDFMPIFSRDSKTVVFASSRHGNYDVYSIPLAGGATKRLTYHSANDFPYCFSADGKSVIFGSTRTDNATMSQFPYGLLGETYIVSLEGGREKQELSICAEDIKWNKAGTKMLFHDRKGYEDPWRKHHTSSVARDVWMYNKTDQNFKKLTAFEGEDRNPVWNNTESEIFYLSEKSGSYNVWKMNESGENSSQVTKFEKNPIRFLSIADNNTLCFGYDGEIYTQAAGQEPKRVSISIISDEGAAEAETKVSTNGATEMAVSPNGKEIAFILHGEVFATNVEGGYTKRITNTPEQERNISFSPDGKALLYASERNNIWGIYQTKLTRKEDNYFFNSTVLTEEALVVNKNESFQPAFSPDGKEIAYLENRTGVNIYNLATKKTRVALPANRNYSYSDGDQSFDWSPDSKHILVSYLQDGSWHGQLGLIDVSGKQPLMQLTQSGFDSEGARFAMNGKAVVYYSNRNGMKNVASHGAQQDAYALFFTKETYDQFKMKDPEFSLWKEQADKNKPKEDTTKKDVAPIKIETEGLLERKARLTPSSGQLADVLLSPDGGKLYYFTSTDDGMNLWVRDFKKEETKILAKLSAGWAGNASFDKEAKNIFCMIDGSIAKIDVANGERKNIGFKAEFTWDGVAERSYLYEHIWRQVKEKFYVTNLQNVDWEYYKGIYAKQLPYINNNYDFAELCSELLGELNASHTGCRYRPYDMKGDNTADLGAYFDASFTGKGLKIQEVLEHGPLTLNDSKIKAGCIIEKIDGVEITADMNYFPLLNRKVDVITLLTVFDPVTNKRWEETVKPIHRGEANYLYYERWIKRMQAMTDKLSNGQLGYMHVEGMNDEAYREFYDQVMGKYYNKKALIVDTRFNGGGWLHDDLATFLSGKKYIEFVPREQKIGFEPGSKWTKPSCVLMGEGNYSDAHMFPVVYKTLGIGKLIGMPVPGTGTAVWWETLQDNSLVFGIPQVGVMTMDGKYYENTQCEPDIKVSNDYNTMLKGEDAQLKAAVEELLK